MKSSQSKKQTTVDLQRTVAIQSFALVALAVAFVVLVAVVAVLLSQVNSHHNSIEILQEATAALSSSK